MNSPADRYAASRRRAADERTALHEFRALYDFDLDGFQVEACRALPRLRPAFARIAERLGEASRFLP